MEGDPNFVKWLATLGVGGVLAAFMFMYYRKDVKQYTELWRVMADMLMKVIQDNTASNIKLISLIEHQEKDRIRKEDILALMEARLRGKGGFEG